MCVGKDAPPRGNETAAAAAELPLALPWEGEVGLRMGAEHLHRMAYLELTVWVSHMCHR